MYCQKCGATLLDSDRFCPECGEKIIAANSGAADTVNRTNMGQTIKTAGETVREDMGVGDEESATEIKKWTKFTIIYSLAYIVLTGLSPQFFNYSTVLIDDQARMAAYIMALLVCVSFCVFYKMNNKICALIGTIVSIMNLLYCVPYFAGDILQFATLLAAILTVLSVITVIKIKRQKN
ncbi:MAG: zinc ribbon domain-containing protein [Acetatifactor sp.]|nr:zinc ribbon domain-containing protein [Acetatifactor sp.]